MIADHGTPADHRILPNGLTYPFAGIIRIRFVGYNLSRLGTP